MITAAEREELEDFVSKIDWEGGTTSALDYGLESEDYPGLPADVAEKWDAVREGYEEFEQIENEFWAAVRAHGVDY